jgi:hypothetical protein
MKTPEEIKQEMEAKLASFEQEMQALQAEYEKAASGALPDILENFNPFKIRDVLMFLEDNKDYIIDKPRYFDGTGLVYSQGDILKFGRYIIEIVDQVGGEGEGDHWHSVFKVSEHYKPDRYFYIPGYYASYNGTDIEWDDIYEVEPYEKTVTDWRAKK